MVDYILQYKTKNQDIKGPSASPNAIHISILGEVVFVKKLKMVQNL